MEVEVARGVLVRAVRSTRRQWYDDIIEITVSLLLHWMKHVLLAIYKTTGLVRMTDVCYSYVYFLLFTFAFPSRCTSSTYSTSSL